MVTVGVHHSLRREELPRGHTTFRSTRSPGLGRDVFRSRSERTADTVCEPHPKRSRGDQAVARAIAVELPDGRRLSLECWPGDGAPLVLLHGLLDCGVGWKHLAEVMQRPCYAVDLPGFGNSDGPTRNRISAYAEDVQAALATLDVHEFTLVGHSLGGAVATRWQNGCAMMWPRSC